MSYRGWSKDKKTWKYVFNMKISGCPDCGERWHHNYFSFYKRADPNMFPYFKGPDDQFAKYLLTVKNRRLVDSWVYECPKCHKRTYHLQDEWEKVF
jgi:hypothetical protein